MATRLPQIVVGFRAYYADDRLEEFRSVLGPMDPVPYVTEDCDGWPECAACGCSLPVILTVARVRHEAVATICCDGAPEP